ncbi:hypothetical protein D9M68_877310 [compost metagenome]
MHDVLAGEIAKAQEHPDRLVLAEHIDVLAPSLVFGAGVEDVFRLAVDGPFATLAVEHPAAHLGTVDFLVAQRAQRPRQVGHLAEVLLRRVAVHQQLEHLGA